MKNRSFFVLFAVITAVLLLCSGCAPKLTVLVSVPGGKALNKDASFSDKEQSGGLAAEPSETLNVETTAAEQKSENIQESTVYEGGSPAEQAPASEALTEDLQGEPAQAPTQAPAQAPTQTPADPNDPSRWTMQQIIDCYKSGMKKTDEKYDCVSDQKMQLVGKLPGKAAAISGPVNLAMKLGSQPIDKLTGGYWDLVPDDLIAATAVKDGDYVVISLTPKEQTDGPDGKEHEGHVGHVVNVVEGIDGFLAYVEENFGILNAKYTKEGVKIHYPTAYARNVRINTKTGEMESGEWGYIIDLHINDASVLGVSLDNFNATIQYDCWYPSTR